MDFYEGGDLFTFIINLSRPLKEKEVKKLILQLSEAVLYLHSRRIVHRDISAKVKILSH